MTWKSQQICALGQAQRWQGLAAAKTCFRQYSGVWAKILSAVFVNTCVTGYFSFCSV